VNHPFIAIEGNIGAGKTTLASMLAQELSGQLILEEFADNSFLQNFYSEPEKFAFPLEMSFLAARYRQLSDEIHNENHNKLIISDYHIEKSLLFASVNLRNDELKLYQSFFSIISSRLRYPDLLVYLNNTPADSLHNIKLRNREFEQNIGHHYLTSIHETYHLEVSKFKAGKVLIINTSHLDFVNKQTDYEVIRDSIIRELSISTC